MKWKLLSLSKENQRDIANPKQDISQASKNWIKFIRKIELPNSKNEI